MPILLTGLNHRTAPLAVRERLSVPKSHLPGALDTLREHVGGGVILSTCNRTEVYVEVGSLGEGSAALDGFFRAQFGDGIDGLRSHLYTLRQRSGVEHLFRVACSLDSMVIGESQILGQVRDAYSAAAGRKVARGLLGRLFHQALRVGKRARRETGIGRNALSISRACVEMARRTLGELRDRDALVVGVGEASKLAAQALRDAGIRRLTVTNRTREYAEELARDLDGSVAPLEELPGLVEEADIVVSSTGSPDLLVSEALVRRAMLARPERPLFVIDIAVPRDVDPAVGRVPGVHLYDIDQLEMVAEANRQEREAEAVKVEEIVQEEVARFEEWWAAQDVTPTIAAMRLQAEELRETETRRTLQRLPGLSARERSRVEALSKALVKKLLHGPTQLLRERRDRSYTQAARDLFGLSLDAGSPSPADGGNAAEPTPKRRRKPAGQAESRRG